MLNCPGANGNPAWPSAAWSVSVKMSPVSRLTCWITNGTGRMGSAREPGTAGATRWSSARLAIEVQQLHARGLEPTNHHAGESAHELVAERLVAVAFLPEARPIQR